MKRTPFFTFTIVLFVSACGGGSGGNTIAPPSPPPPGGSATLVVTTANAKPAARSAYGSTLQSVDTGGLVSTAGIAASPGDGLLKPQVRSTLSRTLTRTMQKDPLGPDTFDCDVSGTTTISGEIATPLTLSTGDQIIVVSANCDDGLGEVVNGTVEFTVTTFSGDILQGLFLLEIDVTLVDLQIVTATDTITTNGDSTVSLDTTGAPIFATSVSGNSLAVVSNASTETLSNFSTAQTVDTSVAPAPYTLSASGTVNSTQVGGTFSFETPVTFQGAGSGYPFAGELLITGANGATVRLIAVDATNVGIEIDTNGDGSIDSTEDTTWEDIAP